MRDTGMDVLVCNYSVCVKSAVQELMTMNTKLTYSTTLSACSSCFRSDAYACTAWCSSVHERHILYDQWSDRSIDGRVISSDEYVYSSQEANFSPRSDKSSSTISYYHEHAREMEKMNLPDLWRWPCCTWSPRCSTCTRRGTPGAPAPAGSPPPWSPAPARRTPA